jgi:hypothetical protein
MNNSRWNEQRSFIKINSNNLSEFLNSYDDLTIYFHLKSIWVVIIDEISKREDIQWPTVFNDSIDIQYIDTNNTKPQKIQEEPQLIKELDQAFLNKSTSLDATWLADNLNKVDQLRLTNSKKRVRFYQALTRFLLNQQSETYLGAYYAWLEVVQYVVLNPQSFKYDSNKSIFAFLDTSSKWFVERQQQINQVNQRILGSVNDTVSVVKEKLENSNQEIAVNGLPSAFSLLQIDINSYMQSPYRKKLHSNLEVCLNISDEYMPYPQLPIDLKQFYGCINDLTFWAVEESKSRELSGTLLPTISDQAFDRALQLPSWQIINTLHSQVADLECLEEKDQQVNPLEWQLASETMMWFADRWPNFIGNGENFNVPLPSNYINPKTQLNKVIAEGEKLKNGFSCLSNSNEQLLETTFNAIQQSWQQVQLDITKVTNEFVETNLNKSSDLDLLDSFEQKSNYRVEGAAINACDATTSCGVHVDLDASREIYKLFPNHLLLADQLKLGELKLCYDNLGWENRHSTATHLDNDNVANYVGQLSFSLKGFYNQDIVFERKIIAKQENLYLFSKNDEEVLNKYCPLEIVGQKISTQLKRGTFGLVPNRLTFLTASRADESKILKNNWQAGEEWQDKIVDDSSVNIISSETLEQFIEPVQESFRQQSTKLQNTIYNSMLRKQANPTEKQQALSLSYAEMNRNIGMLTSLFAVTSDDLLTDDKTHGILFGLTNIPTMASLSDWHSKQLGIKQMIILMSQRLNENQELISQIGDFKPWYSISDTLFRLKQLLAKLDTNSNKK